MPRTSAIRSPLEHVRPPRAAGSGYDRGHLCPSADRTRTSASNGATFLLTNMQPQLHALNAGAWSAMERFERELATARRKDVYVIAGGIFADKPKTIGNGVAVPTASFKILVALDDGEGATDVTTATPIYAAIMPNTSSVNQLEWASYLTRVDEVERQSGYDFLARVPRIVQTAVEARAQIP